MEQVMKNLWKPSFAKAPKGKGGVFERWLQKLLPSPVSQLIR